MLLIFSGHVLCDKCLFDSLIAAIKRNPHPLPQLYARGGQNGGTRGRGNPRRGIGRVGTRGQPAVPVFEPDPDYIEQSLEWTVESLKAAWYKAQMQKYEAKLIHEEIERENWDMIKENDDLVPSEDKIEVKDVLNGLWTVNGEYAVIEGECPVSRHGCGCL